MAEITLTSAVQQQLAPVRRLVAAGIKRTGQPWLVEQPQQSAADQAAASYVRRPAMTP